MVKPTEPRNVIQPRPGFVALFFHWRVDILHAATQPKVHSVWRARQHAPVLDDNVVGVITEKKLGEPGKGRLIFVNGGRS